MELFYEVTRADAQLLGAVRELTARANIAWRGRRVYSDQYYGANLFTVYRMPLVKENDDREHLVPLDTVSNAENLTAAIRLLKIEIEEAA